MHFLHFALNRRCRSFYLQTLSYAFLLLATGHAHAAGQWPVISGSPSTVATVGQVYSFQPAAKDADGDVLTFGITNKPSWATFDTKTGRLSGTPASGNVGKYASVTIKANDGSLSAFLPQFSITVSAATSNKAPLISGTPATTATVGSAYSFQPTASDPEGKALSFSIANKPSWAAFDTKTGRLSGTPASTNVATFSNVQIKVSDGSLTTSLAAFAIVVKASTANRAPVISGTPAKTATPGVAYSFQPVASDPDGNTLGFTILNKPSWATFSTTTGKLSGTPASGNVGTFSGIRISVSDSKATVSLPDFSIAVANAALPSSRAITLSWYPPTANTNGTPLVNLGGYRIYYGTSASSMTSTITLTNPGLTAYVIENLAAGTWYVAMASRTTTGVEGPLSGVLSKTIK